MIRFQCKLNIKEKEEVLSKVICGKLRVRQEDMTWRIAKKSLDARKKDNIFWLYTIDVTLKDKSTEEKLLRKSNDFRSIEDKKYSFKPIGSLKLSDRPVIIGCGPAGLFCAYQLALSGFRPIVLERGEDIDNRTLTVNDFWNGGTLKPSSNVQFGEGGAGTFSDGKLNTGVKDPSGRIEYVLNTFVKFGAKPSIQYDAKPHIGTDELKKVIKNIRNEAIKLGADFRFNSCVIDLNSDQTGNICSVVLANGDIIETEIVVLAIGHSSRDTFRMLSSKNILMKEKSFAIGLRIEHLRDSIGLAQYGEAYRLLPSADYKMTQSASDGRGVYSFCMCPGGFVVNASSQEGKLCVNGMSNSGRDEVNSNSAIVVQVNPSDYQSEGFEGTLSGVCFQEKWEQKAFEAGSGCVPVQRFEDFKAGRVTKTFNNINPNTKGRYALADLTKVIPSFVRNDIIEGVEKHASFLKGFNDPDAVLSGVETRTSSPVQILRDEAFESSIKGLYPCGEGCGYAGGIMSAAVDGIKVYEAIASKYKGDDNELA